MPTRRPARRSSPPPPPPTPTNLSELVPDDRNANRGTPRGNELLESSVRELGAGRSVLIDRDNRVIAGNKTVEAAQRAGITRLRVVETDGSELVAVKRTDLTLDGAEARRLAIVDNRAGDLNLDFDAEVVVALAAEHGFTTESVGMTAEEIEAMRAVAAAGEQSGGDEVGDGGGVDTIGETYEVIATLRDEREQRALYARLQAEGFSVRVSTI